MRGGEWKEASVDTLPVTTLHDAREMPTTRRRAMHAEQGDDSASSAQSPDKEEWSEQASGLASRQRGERDGFVAYPSREQNPGVGGDDAAQDRLVYGFALIVMVFLPQVFRKLWPSYLVCPVVLSAVLYHLIKALYGQHLQEWLHGMDANTVSKRNVFVQFMYAVKANNTDFYGPTVGQNTKWSSTFSLFYTNATLGSAWRLGRMGWKHRNDEASMKSLAVVVLLQQLLHMGLVRIHSTIRVAARAAADVAWEVIMNVRQARHAQVFSLSIVGGGIHVFLLLLERDGAHVLRFLYSRFNLILKLGIDHVYYCLRLFLVDDPMYALVGRRGEDSKLVEMCALHHLMESMFGDLVLTVSVASTPQLYDAWAEADLFVQIVSMAVLLWASLNKTIPLQLEREGLNARNIFDFLLKCAVIMSHSMILYGGVK
jgi:hypothetical protein